MTTISFLAVIYAGAISFSSRLSLTLSTDVLFSSAVLTKCAFVSTGPVPIKPLHASRLVSAGSLYLFGIFPLEMFLSTTSDLEDAC